MNILTKQPLTTPPPTEVVRHFNQIEGDLVCSNCKEVLQFGSGEGAGHDWISETIEYIMAAHRCGKEKLKYDFNDPRTIIEQLRK